MNKFVVIGQQGSGTRFLTDFLNSHPDVNLEGEFLNSKPMMVFEDVKKQIANGRSFNVKYNHLFYYGDDGNDLINHLYNEGYLCIHLKRDPARTFIRHIAKYEGTVTRHDVKDFVEKITNWQNKVDEVFGDRCLEVYYEEISKGRPIEKIPYHIERKMQSFIGVKYKPLEADMSHRKILEHLL